MEGHRINDELRFSVNNKVEECNRTFGENQHVKNLNKKLRDDNEDLKLKNFDLES